MKRMHLKRYKKKSIINKILIIVILLFISVIYILKIFSERAVPEMINYSEIETKKVVSSLINVAVIDEISTKTTMDDLFITLKDSNGDIKSIDIDSSKVNKILVDASKIVEQNLKYLENGEVDKLKLNSNYDKDKLKKGIIYELPSGIIFNNVLLNNVMPKIPVKINLIGNIFCRLNTEVESYGINNALIKVSIGIEAEVKILLPFTSTNTKITTNVPVVIKILEGNIPSYYFDGYLNSLSVSTSV